MLAFVEEESEYWQDVLVSIGTTRLQGLHPNTNHFVLKQSQLLLKPLELRKLPPEIVTKAKFITTKSRLLYLLRMKWNFAKKNIMQDDWACREWAARLSATFNSRLLFLF